jgi:DNA-directed RNA polymerase subunit RPC12/RpoP
MDGDEVERAVYGGEAPGLNFATLVEYSRGLRSLDAHNAERLAAHAALRAPHPSGIACPNCGNELTETPDVIPDSDPPEVPVACPHCGYRGGRVL